MSTEYKMKIVCYYDGTGIDVLIDFPSLVEFEEWKVNNCEAYILKSLRRGSSIDYIKGECLEALEILHQEILTYVGLENEFTLKKIKKLWKEEFTTKCGMWYMNVACLIKLRVLENDDMNGWQIITPTMMALLAMGGRVTKTTLDGHKCEVCRKETSNKCSRCRTAYYCCGDCQNADWKEHKKICCKK